MMTIRDVVVRELEASCDRADRPIFWRIDDQGRAERGHEVGHYKVWTLVHPLSTFLLAERRRAKENYDPEIPY